MKRIIFFLFLFSLTVESSKAQTYHKLLNNSEWFQAMIFGFGIPTGYYWYYQDIDTIVNSTTYSKIHDTYFGSDFYLREDTLTKKVYILTSDTTESILYDFSMNVGDSLSLVGIGNIPNNKIVKVALIDTISTGQGDRRRFKLCIYLNSTTSDTFYVVEGVGSINDPMLLYNWVQDPVHLTVCSYQNQVSIFHNSYFSFQCPIRNAPCNISATISGTTILCDTLCSGVIAVTPQGTAIPPFQYYWSNSGGQMNNTLTGLCAGSYGVSVTDGLGCFTSAWHTIIQNTAMNLTVVTLPDSGNNSGTATVAISGGTPPYTFSWSNSSTSSSITELTTGTYYLSVTDSLGCSVNDSAIIGTSITTSILESAHKIILKVYPSPFSNQFTVGLSNNKQTTISLFNFLGQQVLQQTFTNSATINTEQLADGIYFYELRNDKGLVTNGKVIRQ